MQEYVRHPLLVKQDEGIGRLFNEYVNKLRADRKPVDYQVNALLRFGN